jgi:hypothetical protein
MTTIAKRALVEGTVQMRALVPWNTAENVARASLTRMKEEILKATAAIALPANILQILQRSTMMATGI